MHFAGKAHGPVMPCTASLEKLCVVFFQHTRTRAGWRDDIVKRFKCLDGALRDRDSGSVITAVVGRLATTGLRRRHIDCAASRFKQLYRRERDAGAVEINEASDKQTDIVGHDASCKKSSFAPTVPFVNDALI